MVGTGARVAQDDLSALLTHLAKVLMIVLFITFLSSFLRLSRFGDLLQLRLLTGCTTRCSGCLLLLLLL
ncbi:hypothetical protein PMAYCL1PPCAC_31194, partial [Pristionchus mayeri]